MIDSKILTEYLSAACEIHGKPYSEALLKGWAGCTGSVSTMQFEEAFWSVAAERFPKPSDLLQAVAGISPSDDWEVIMMVACGNAAEGQISGYAASALRRIGGVRKLATANEIETRSLHKEFAAIMTEARPTNGLPPAPEVISLAPAANNFISDPQYKPDHTGEHRANALIKLLKVGGIKPDMARRLAGHGTKLGQTQVAAIPQAQRDRVLAAAMEIEQAALEKALTGIY
jgi:hypothetical protein